MGMGGGVMRLLYLDIDNLIYIIFIKYIAA